LFEISLIHRESEENRKDYDYKLCTKEMILMKYRSEIILFKPIKIIIEGT